MEHGARVVGELDRPSAVAACGWAYSGGFDWSVQPGPVETALDALTVAPQDPRTSPMRTDSGVKPSRATIRRPYWNDIGYPVAANVLQLFGDHYNAGPDGVTNDRFNDPGSRAVTPRPA